MDYEAFLNVNLNFLALVQPSTPPFLTTGGYGGKRAGSLRAPAHSILFLPMRDNRRVDAFDQIAGISQSRHSPHLAIGNRVHSAFNPCD
jgi:hypothetical protein